MGRGEKVIKLILKFFAVGFFVGIIFTTFKSLAEEHPVFPPGVMNTQQIPIYCGPGPLVFSYAGNVFKQKAIAWSDVKSSGDPNSETFAYVSFWYSEELENGSVFLTIKETGETCLMGYGMDWIFDAELLLDIVNSSLANESKQSKELNRNRSEGN